MALFSGAHYVLSSSIQAEWRRGLSGLLDLHGATSTPPHTHLIALAGSHTQSEHQGSLHVVSGMWVQRSVVLGKCQLQRVSIVACATDLSRWDLEVLSAGITSLGGQWRTALTRDYQTAMHFAPHTHMSVLTPHWFDDSVQAGCHVPEKPYLWPDPEVLGLASKIPISGLQFRRPINGQPHRGVPGYADALVLGVGFQMLLVFGYAKLNPFTEEEIVEGGRQRRRVQGIHYNAADKPGSPRDNCIVPTPVRARASAISWT
ncbi:hypothetical protein EDB19DRAFT_1839677 [Suillus lakei]|nr:hypothetical protein EDB19DRAFT_1839677 [Suillus lakei]